MFDWGPEQQRAFDDLKQYLTKLTTLSRPSLGEVLLLYLATSPTTVSALSGAKLNYIELEKIAYTIIMASKKLKHYFQAHRIRVLSV